VSPDLGGRFDASPCALAARHYRPEKNFSGPSWLTFLGHIKDSLWSIDLFRCESPTLRAHWVLVVMDQYTPQGQNIQPSRKRL